MEKSNQNNISQIKYQLQNVIKNLHELDDVVNSSAYEERSTGDLQELMNKTNKLLTELEAAKLEDIGQILQKRKRTRKIKKLKKQLKQQRIQALKNHQQPEVSSKKSSNLGNQSQKKEQINFYRHQYNPTYLQILKRHDSRRFQSTFNLLQLLLKVRCQNETFSNDDDELKLENLQQIWSTVAKDSPQNCKTVEHIESQWNRVLFGAKEKTEFNKTLKKRFNDFLRIRRTWDSYLTENATLASSIPVGWILPSKEVSMKWNQYRRS